jgi:ATP-dependent Zn protease
MGKYRQLLIKAKSKSVAFLLAEKHEAAFKDVTGISEYTKEVSEALDY